MTSIESIESIRVFSWNCVSWCFLIVLRCFKVLQIFKWLPTSNEKIWQVLILCQDAAMRRYWARGSWWHVRTLDGSIWQPCWANVECSCLMLFIDFTDFTGICWATSKKRSQYPWHSMAWNVAMSTCHVASRLFTAPVPRRAPGATTLSKGPRDTYRWFFCLNALNTFEYILCFKKIYLAKTRLHSWFQSFGSKSHTPNFPSAIISQSSLNPLKRSLKYRSDAFLGKAPKSALDLRLLCLDDWSMSMDLRLPPTLDATTRPVGSPGGCCRGCTSRGEDVWDRHLLWARMLLACPKRHGAVGIAASSTHFGRWSHIHYRICWRITNSG